MWRTLLVVLVLLAGGALALVAGVKALWRTSALNDARAAIGTTWPSDAEVLVAESKSDLHVASTLVVVRIPEPERAAFLAANPSWSRACKETDEHGAVATLCLHGSKSGQGFMHSWDATFHAQTGLLHVSIDDAW